MVNIMQRAIVLDVLSPLPESIASNDPNDAFLLATTLINKADSLMTGDHHAELQQRDSIGSTRIVTPANFCAKALLRPESRLGAVSLM